MQTKAYLGQAADRMRAIHGVLLSQKRAPDAGGQGCKHNRAAGVQMLPEQSRPHQEKEGGSGVTLTCW